MPSGLPLHLLIDGRGGDWGRRTVYHSISLTSPHARPSILPLPNSSSILPSPPPALLTSPPSASPTASPLSSHTPSSPTRRARGGSSTTRPGTAAAWTASTRARGWTETRSAELQAGGRDRRSDFVICRRIGTLLFPVVLDLPPGNKGMEFVTVLLSSRVICCLLI